MIGPTALCPHSYLMFNLRLLIGHCTNGVRSAKSLKLTQRSLRKPRPIPHRAFHLNITHMCELSQHDPKDAIVWMDMEMTGLDISKDQIMEVACMITDQNLNTIAEGPELIIHTSDHLLDTMHPWCIEHHGKSGLTESARKSKITIQEAGREILDFLKLHTPPGTCPLAGNSVYMDRLFVRQHMPLVDAHLHYRIIDVSTVKELCRRWCPEQYSRAPKKVYGHRAMNDVRESIQELHYYRTVIFDKLGTDFSI